MLKERAVKPKDTVGHGRLNPYFNGTCSKRGEIIPVDNYGNCLNPYFNGTCSKSILKNPLMSL